MHDATRAELSAGRLDLGRTLDGHPPAEILGGGLLRWLLSLRWVAVICAAGVVGAATLLTARVQTDAVVPLWLGVLALAVLNTVLSVGSSSGGPVRFASRRGLAVQVSLDALILLWLLHHAGGVLNPFAALFVFHAVIAGVVLPSRDARWVALAIAAGVLAGTALAATGWLPAHCLGDALGRCAATDPMTIVAAGGGVAVLVVGCANIVVALVRNLREEHASLVHTRDALSTQARVLERAREELHGERERLQTIIDCMADAVLYVTPDGVVRLHNRAAAGFWPDRAEGDARDLRTCHREDKWQEIIAKITAPEPVEVHPLFEVGVRAYEGSYARVCDAQGGLLGVVMVARDVTERNATHRYQMHQERMAVVGKLAAALAHEMNNPLGTIVLFAQHALSELHPSEVLCEHLGTVLRNANLCKKIVRDLLEYARQRPPERRDVKVGALLADAKRTLEPHAQKSAVALTIDDAADPQAHVEADPDQIHQVLVNLGLNAIEAALPGGRVDFLLGNGSASAVHILVRDNGAGVRPEDVQQIFTAFYTTKSEGTGLGLTVARDLIAAHAGTVELAGTSPRGTTFAIRLPRAEAPAREVRP